VSQRPSAWRPHTAVNHHSPWILIMDNLETFIDKFNQAVDFQEPVAVTAETKLESLPEWDSLAALGVIVMFDMEYGKTITGEHLKQAVTLQDLYQLLA